jgi:ubiquinone/menaquinone biosynthesis C-methylase UbiE
MREMGLTHFDGNMDSEYLWESAKRVEKVKRTSYDLMRLRAGMMVLDIGCGPGIDVRNLSGLVGDGGHVIGIDSDDTMIADAVQGARLSNTQP